MEVGVTAAVTESAPGKLSPLSRLFCFHSRVRGRAALGPNERALQPGSNDALALASSVCFFRRSYYLFCSDVEMSE